MANTARVSIRSMRPTLLPEAPMRRAHDETGTDDCRVLAATGPLRAHDRRGVSLTHAADYREYRLRAPPMPTLREMPEMI